MVWTIFQELGQSNFEWAPSTLIKSKLPLPLAIKYQSYGTRPRFFQLISTWGQVHCYLSFTSSDQGHCLDILVFNFFPSFLSAGSKSFHLSWTHVNYISKGAIVSVKNLYPICFKNYYSTFIEFFFYSIPC